MALISGTDFVMVPVGDFEEARKFYGEVLELEQSKSYGKAKLEERGVEFIHSLDSGVCWMSIFKDPWGNTYTLHHRYAPPEARPPGLDEG